MSLTSHLANPTQSPIGRFFRERFAFTARLTKDANRQLRETQPILPAEHPWPYSHIGMAFDYRIRYSFAITPCQDLVAWHGAQFLLNVPERLTIQLKLLGLSSDESTLPDTKLIEIKEPDAIYGPYYSLEVIEAFFETLQTTLEKVQPVGRLLDTESEQVLARYCFLLGLLEEPFRTSRYREGMLMVPAPHQSLAELLAISQQSWIDDLCALFRLFYNRQAHLLSRPSVLNPTFAGSTDVGGADADLIVDGCLIDIKTTKQSAVDSEWIRQIAGYLLLDYHDIYRLNSVGLYLARHGMLLSWPVEHFVQTLTGESNITVATLRQEFQDLIGDKLPQK